MTRSMCSTGRSTRSRSWRGVSMITSCAPTPFIRSWTPIPLRSSSPSMRSAGNLFGTTRTSQPGRLGGPPPGRSARISGGVLLSFPSQKGQSAPAGISAWRGKLAGARLRSEAMMTQRFWIGSCRSSGMTLPLDRFHDSRGGTDIWRDEVILCGVFLHHAPGVEARDQRRHRPAHPGDPLARNGITCSLSTENRFSPSRRSCSSIDSGCESGPMAKPLAPSWPSRHQPSRMLRLRPPWQPTFWPLVPQASSGRRGVFSQTSHPEIIWRATCTS